MARTPGARHPRQRQGGALHPLEVRGGEAAGGAWQWRPVWEACRQAGRGEATKPATGWSRAAGAATTATPPSASCGGASTCRAAPCRPLPPLAARWARRRTPPPAACAPRLPATRSCAPSWAPSPPSSSPRRSAAPRTACSTCLPPWPSARPSCLSSMAARRACSRCGCETWRQVGTAPRAGWAAAGALRAWPCAGHCVALASTLRCDKKELHLIHLPACLPAARSHHEQPEDVRLAGSDLLPGGARRHDGGAAGEGPPGPARPAAGRAGWLAGC